MTDLALAIAVKGEWNPDRLLSALTDAGIGPSTEVHVACDLAYVPEISPPDLMIHSLGNASLFELWGFAIDRSQADWIAILHAGALPAAGWFDAMAFAIEREEWRDGYWGPVEPDFGPMDSRMVGYLTEYMQFARPIEAGLKEIPGSNLILPRARIANAGDFSKTRLLGEGLSPKYVEGAVVRYARPFKLTDYCGRRFRHGRAYAAKRTPKRSAVVTVPLSVALPAVRVGRVLRHAWRHEQLRLPSLRWLPAILLAETFWSIGELVGDVTGRAGDPGRLD